MHRSIDYYFSLVSPWAYIGHATFMDLTQRHSLDVNFKPVSLPTIFAETGGLPLNKRAPARQRYRIMELQRWREKRGVQLQVQGRGSIDLPASIAVLKHTRSSSGYFHG